MHGDMNHIHGSLLVIQMRLLFSVACPRDLFCLGDVELVFVGVSTFVGVLGGLCNLFLPFLTLLGSVLDTTATIAQPKFFLCLCHFIGLSELSEYMYVT